MDARSRPRILVSTTVLTVAVLASSACSRLSFVRPDFSRGDFERVAQDVDVSGNGRGRKAAEAMQHMQLAQVRLVAGDYATAEREAGKALKLDPRSADAHTVLAAVAAQRGAAEQAGEHYRRATELAPGKGAVMNNYGVWLCGQGRQAESLAWFEQALTDRYYATPALALANAGSCAIRAGQDARGEQYLRKAIEVEPGNAQALGALAELEFRRDNAFAARAFSERRLAAAPADPGALQLASQIEEKLGDRAAAARYVQRMRAEFPQTQGSGMGDDGKR